jgi:hypothetical protein
MKTLFLKTISTPPAGFVLILSLLILLVVTLFAIAALDSSITELRISRHHFNSVEAFWNAEAGLAVGKATSAAWDYPITDDIFFEEVFDDDGILLFSWATNYWLEEETFWIRSTGYSKADPSTKVTLETRFKFPPLEADPPILFAWRDLF